MSGRPLKASGLLQAHAGATTGRKTPEITTDEELERAVSRMRDAGTDIAEYEMKEARGYPSNVVDSLCAFANTTGGVVILGVSEKDFQPVDIDVKKLQARLASSARNEIEPAIHIDIKVLYLAGKPVVVANVPPIDAALKPCYVKKYGLERGAFIRTGDGDYRMSAYEIHRFQENEQLCSGHDCAIVSRATIGDLDDRLVKRWVGAVAGGGTADGSGVRVSGSVQAVAQRYGVLVADKKGELHPSLAGLLVFGKQPQQFMPHLNLVLVDHVHANTAGSVTSTRRTSPTSSTCPVNPMSAANPANPPTITFNGSIPAIMKAVMRAATGELRSSASTQLRAAAETLHCFPWNAVREALINAFVHRDYSPDSLGLPILMDMYDDRLEITSPGGLFAPFSATAEARTSKRNATLAALVQHIPFGTREVHGGKLSENAGSGWPIIEQEMLAISGKSPEIISTLHDFRIILHL
ncbi:RNA-binding domain-containing protein [Aeriscardovia aeriphila]|uniref:ATP-dependent DNA helicase recG C-terminal n=1 Tax=Aeriscardovia aeriphila TaxID=218139 RepID=A0A261F894_9BIFI|nr:RNA-binding domain-containing protein [Aeriscardovia aeriphila]NYI25138.1 ATP-dependent DNA helicase RecG [Aeriscardovia aeriphila]OZG55314.1 ATP-dependent DNA helicase recG C-terminal [Aeriscardovia aeriphila]